MCGASACQLLADLHDVSLATEAGVDAASDVSSDVAPEAAPCEMCGGSKCVDFSNDVTNCGFCGHACAGCAGTLCPVETIASFDSAAALAVDDTNVYVGDVSGVHAVVKASKTVSLISPVFWPQDLTTSNGRVYAATPWAIVNMAPDGGDLRDVYARAYDGGTNIFTSVVVAEPTIYWGSQGGIFVASTDGGNERELVSEDAGYLPSCIGVDSTSVYFTEPQRLDVTRAPLDGAPPSQLGSSIAQPTCLAVGAGVVYWGDIFRLYATGTGIDGGTHALVSEDVVYDMTLHADRIYFAVLGSLPNSGAIFTMPIAGGAPTLLAKADSPARLVADDAFVYWLENTSSNPSTLKRVAR